MNNYIFFLIGVTTGWVLSLTFDWICDKRRLKKRDKELTTEVIEELEKLYKKIDTVYVLRNEERQYCKQKLKDTILYIKKQSKRIDLIQEAEFTVGEKIADSGGRVLEAKT